MEFVFENSNNSLSFFKIEFYFSEHLVIYIDPRFFLNVRFVASLFIKILQ